MNAILEAHKKVPKQGVKVMAVSSIQTPTVHAAMETVDKFCLSCPLQISRTRIVRAATLWQHANVSKDGPSALTELLGQIPNTELP